jgi:hypothetical protein
MEVVTVVCVCVYVVAFYCYSSFESDFEVINCLGIEKKGGNVK